MYTDKPKVLVTGAASGIGRAVARRFAAEGYAVCLNDIRDPGPALASLSGSEHLVFHGSFADELEMELLMEHIDGEWGRVDVLVNCAGFSRYTPFVGTPINDWELIFHRISRGALLTSRLVLPLMSLGGRIIHITSIHGERAEYGSGAYAMAKAAINQYCRTLAVELAPHGILVNAIAPGFVNTAMSIQSDGQNELETKWFSDNYVKGHHLPLQRAAEPEEIAGVAWFLAGNDARYITGQVINVDGGLSVTF